MSHRRTRMVPRQRRAGQARQAAVGHVPQHHSAVGSPGDGEVAAGRRPTRRSPPRRARAAGSGPLPKPEPDTCASCTVPSLARDHESPVSPSASQAGHLVGQAHVRRVTGVEPSSARRFRTDQADLAWPASPRRACRRRYRQLARHRGDRCLLRGETGGNGGASPAGLRARDVSSRCTESSPSPVTSRSPSGDRASRGRSYGLALVPQTDVDPGVVRSMSNVTCSVAMASRVPSADHASATTGVPNPEKRDRGLGAPGRWCPTASSPGAAKAGQELPPGRQASAETAPPAVRAPARAAGPGLLEQLRPRGPGSRPRSAAGRPPWPREGAPVRGEGHRRRFCRRSRRARCRVPRGGEVSWRLARVGRVVRVEPVGGGGAQLQGQPRVAVAQQLGLAGLCCGRRRPALPAVPPGAAGRRGRRRWPSPPAAAPARSSPGCAPAPFFFFAAGACRVPAARNSLGDRGSPGTLIRVGSGPVLGGGERRPVVAAGPGSRSRAAQRSA